MKSLTTKSDEQQVRVHGNHFIEVDAADSLALRANHGVFEPDETTLCRQLINCGDRVLDIGANIGYYTLLFSDLVSPHGHVTAIEPDQQNFSCLQRNLAGQVADGIASLHQVALGNEPHNARLDSLELAPLDFIKINIEGYEPAAFYGLADTLKQSHKLKILCEFSPLSLWEAGFSPIDFLKEMQAYGFLLLVKDKQAWQGGSFDEIILALQQIPASAVTQFISNLNRAEGKQAISQQVAVFLEHHGYRRPLLENILFVAPGAWRTVLTTLGLDQTAGLPAETVTKTKWQLRWASIYDQNALLSLFTTAFGQPMQSSLWTWKYAELYRQGILAHIAGRAIAYYGGIPRSFWQHEKELKAVQICDVMVAPEVRGIMTRRGAFALTAKTFLCAQTGANKPCRLAFGFPTGRAARLGERLGMYARGDTFFEASWTTGLVERLPFWLKTEPLHQGNLAVLDKLWQDMRQSMMDYVLPRKDADFFRWRYLEHPLNTYHIYLVSWRWFNKPIGVVVLRDHDVSRGQELMDFVGRPEVFELLLRAALNIARQANRPRVFGWMTTRVIAMLPSPSAQFEISGVYIDPPALKEMVDQRHDRWWFLGGDTDFR
ncbi:FkbM family methyltransferase [Methylobacter sp. YRD-M1]|uniref:FkbM family methyltransferase n=1 Tax=Methylobacter sp. YRD-M1 TaxID=2911520 RepID=UPI00227BBA4F|nr:FkbM family methyltransferase [Methylobacter sp. YRD-M1]WAK01477.1 FkbM family methyltransferase [Methylobacter sp. YRD-M1]